MRLTLAAILALLLTPLVVPPVSAAQAAQTPLVLVADGTYTAPTATQPWTPDPTFQLATGVRIGLTVTASTSAAASNSTAQLLDYFNVVTADEGYAILDPKSGPYEIDWHGQWTNRRGFLLQATLSGQRTSVVSQTPPVLAFAGAAQILGLSGPGRGLTLQATWKGQLNTQTGALHLELTGAAVGALGPTTAVCGDYTDAGLVGEIQPLVIGPDGEPNRDHFFHDATDPYPHPYPYSTNPPTSGPHNPSPLPWGIYMTPQDDESLVHNLEHGGVIVSYLPSLAPAVVERLRALVGLYAEDVVLTPRPANDVPIALTCWGRLQKFYEYDEPAIQNFIDHNRGHGPECFH